MIVTTTTQPPLLKVTKSLYIVTNLGQLLFTLFTEIAHTWDVQRDSVNTAIIHSYSIGGDEEAKVKANAYGEEVKQSIMVHNKGQVNRINSKGVP